MRAEKRYNSCFDLQVKTDMVDGVIDIPLPGKLSDSATDPRGPVPTSHFLVGPENRLVEVAVRSVVEKEPNGYSPLVLYGPSGTGKSHLAFGLAAAWKARDRKAKVVCTTAVDFARELAEAIETQDVDDFRSKYREASLLVIEDLGMLATRRSGKLSAQEELIHTLDVLLAEGRGVIVTLATLPSEASGIVPALQSRLMAGLTVPLAPPGPAARLAVLRQLARVRNIRLSETVARVLADGVSGTVPELAGSLLQLGMPSEAGHGRIDLAAAKRFVAERSDARRPTLHEIALATAKHFSLKLTDLRSSVRRRVLVNARGVAVYLARTLTDESLQQIGSYFGGRDHTTVMHSCRKTEELIESDASIREAVEALKRVLWKT